jgi:Dehydrogenase E1 component
VTTVDCEYVARHHGCGPAQQEDDRPDDLGQLAEALGVRALAEKLIDLGSGLTIPEHQRGLEGRWRHGVDPNPGLGEDNGDAVSLAAAASAAGSPVERARTYAMAAAEVDGMDAETVYEAARTAVDRARAGGGPSYLHMKTYRFRGHHHGEAVLKLPYRSAEEIARWQERDPVQILAGRLASGMQAAIDAEVEAQIQAAIEYGRNGPPPDPSTATDHAYASGLAPRKGA